MLSSFKCISINSLLFAFAFLLNSTSCEARGEIIDGYNPGGEWGGNGGNWTSHPSSWNDHGGYYNDKTSRNRYDETFIYNENQSQSQPAIYPYVNYSNIYYPYGSYTNAYYPYGNNFGNSYYSSYRPYYMSPYAYSYNNNNYSYPTYTNYVYPSYPFNGSYYQNESRQYERSIKIR